MKNNYETPLLWEEAIRTETGFAGSGFGGADEAGASVNESGDYTYSL